MIPKPRRDLLKIKGAEAASDAKGFILKLEGTTTLGSC
jgi:hypothetical protein